MSAKTWLPQTLKLFPLSLSLSLSLPLPLFLHLSISLQGDEKVARRGYWGDIVSSPFLSFGIQSENKDLFKSQNGRHIHVSVCSCTCIHTYMYSVTSAHIHMAHLLQSSVQVSNYNITSLIHKLTTGEDYSPPNSTSTNPPLVGKRSSQGAGSRGCVSQDVIIEEVDEVEGDGIGETQNQGRPEQNPNKSNGRSASQLKGPLFNGGWMTLCDQLHVGILCVVCNCLGLRFLLHHFPASWLCS